MSTAAFCAVLLSFHPPALWAKFQTPCPKACPRRSPSSRWAMLPTISMVAQMWVLNLRRNALRGLQNGRRGPSRRFSGERGTGIAENPVKSPI